MVNYILEAGEMKEKLEDLKERLGSWLTALIVFSPLIYAFANYFWATVGIIIGIIVSPHIVLFLIDVWDSKKKGLLIAAAIGVLLVFCSMQTPESTRSIASASETVYITNTGHKYHRDGCRYLRYSQSSISESKAIERGYGACSVCNP